jgi:nucleoside-diphosphate-sugar epimerase
MYIKGGKKLGAFTYVENLVDGIILAGIRKEAIGQVYIITDGIKLTWRDYFDKLTLALNVPKPWISVHPGLANIFAMLSEFLYRLFRIQTRPLVTRYVVEHLRNDFHFSIEKARKELGYEPKIDIDEAIDRTAKWYKKTVRGE